MFYFVFFLVYLLLFFICSFCICTTCIRAISRDSHWYKKHTYTHIHTRTGLMVYEIGFSVSFFCHSLLYSSFSHLKTSYHLDCFVCLDRCRLSYTYHIYLSVFVYFSLHQQLIRSPESNQFTRFVQWMKFLVLLCTNVKLYFVSSVHTLFFPFF